MSVKLIDFLKKIYFMLSISKPKNFVWSKWKNRVKEENFRGLERLTFFRTSRGRSWHLQNRGSLKDLNSVKVLRILEGEEKVQMTDCDSNQLVEATFELKKKETKLKECKNENIRLNEKNESKFFCVVVFVSFPSIYGFLIRSF